MYLKNDFNLDPGSDVADRHPDNPAAVGGIYLDHGFHQGLSTAFRRLSIAAVTISLVGAIFLLVVGWQLEAPVQYHGPMAGIRRH